MPLLLLQVLIITSHYSSNYYNRYSNSNALYYIGYGRSRSLSLNYSKNMPKSNASSIKLRRHTNHKVWPIRALDKSWGIRRIFPVLIGRDGANMLMRTTETESRWHRWEDHWWKGTVRYVSLRQEAQGLEESILTEKCDIRLTRIFV